MSRPGRNSFFLLGAIRFPGRVGQTKGARPVTRPLGTTRSRRVCPPDLTVRPCSGASPRHGAGRPNNALLPHRICGRSVVGGLRGVDVSRFPCRSPALRSFAGPAAHSRGRAPLNATGDPGPPCAAQVRGDLSRAPLARLARAVEVPPATCSVQWSWASVGASALAPGASRRRGGAGGRSCASRASRPAASGARFVRARKRADAGSAGARRAARLAS